MRRGNLDCDQDLECVTVNGLGISPELRMGTFADLSSERNYLDIAIATFLPWCPLFLSCFTLQPLSGMFESQPFQSEKGFMKETWELAEDRDPVGTKE